MTEAEWLASADPQAMLAHLLRLRDYGTARAEGATDRKLRLFACACAALIARGKEEREFAEKWAAQIESGEDRGSSPPLLPGESWPQACAEGWADPSAAALHAPGPDFQPQKASLLRCILGNPWRPAAFDPEWRHACHSGWINASSIAHVIYTENRWADLPILADALEEAGCEGADLLGPGPHARGCHVVDLVLGKE